MNINTYIRYKDINKANTDYDAERESRFISVVTINCNLIFKCKVTSVTFVTYALIDIAVYFKVKYVYKYTIYKCTALNSVRKVIILSKFNGLYCYQIITYIE